MREREADRASEREGLSTFENRLSCHLTQESRYVLFKLGPEWTIKQSGQSNGAEVAVAVLRSGVADGGMTAQGIP